MASRPDVSSFTTAQLAEFLAKDGETKLEADSIANLVDNRINGATLLELDESDLRELLPRMGERKVIQRFISSYKPKQVTSSCLESSFSDRLVSGNDLLGKFKLPERFSRQTMQAIAEKVITKRARTEIISTMAGEMWRYTETPSSSEYNGVCQLLLKKFPCLKDTIGTGYGSWKTQLRQKFKNMRRDYKPQKRPRPDDDKENEPPSHQAKKAAKGARAAVEHLMQEEETTTEDEPAKYDEDVSSLKEEWATEKPSRKVVRALMRSTRTHRNRWIRSDMPHIEEILQTFPCLKKIKYLWRELLCVIESEPDEIAAEDTWSELRGKIVQLSMRESDHRSSIKAMLDRHVRETATMEDESDDTTLVDLHALELLTTLLSGRNKLQAVHRFLATSSLTQQVTKLDVNYPYVAVVVADSAVQYYLVAERIVMTDCTSLFEALKGLVATYFMANMMYPKPLNALFIFIQHIVLGIKDSQAIPNTVTQVVSSLDKM